MPDQVRIGVIGTSGFTDFVHLTDIKSHPRAQLRAICGRKRERTAELAAKHDIPLVYTDYREMIAQASLDAVVVAVPDDLHFPVVMEALDAGLHVLCEKPLATNADQAQAMYERAEASGCIHMVFFTWPWLTHYQRLHRLLAEGYIGQPRHCSLSYLADYGRNGSYNWRWDARRSSGILGDLGSHLIHFARLYVGEIARVSARLDAFVERTDGDGQSIPAANDAATLAVQFANGAQGVIQVNAVTCLANRFMEQRITLGGDAGTLVSEFSFADRLLHGARSGAERFEIFEDFTYGADDDNFGDIFAVFRTQSVGDRLFIDAILEDKPTAPNFYDGLRVQQVIDAALTSQREARWVAVAGS